MEDFPRDLLEFEARFSTEEACREYLFRLRWPDGFVCPRCAGGRLGRARGSVAVRELRLPKFGDSRNDLSRHAQTSETLVSAVWWVTSQKTGASAMGLQRVLV